MVDASLSIMCSRIFHRQITRQIPSFGNGIFCGVDLVPESASRFIYWNLHLFSIFRPIITRQIGFFFICEKWDVQKWRYLVWGGGVLGYLELV